MDPLEGQPAEGTYFKDTVDLLGRSPAVLDALLSGLPEPWTASPDVTGGWLPRDVVGHLITGELTDWPTRASLIIEHGTSVPFERFDRVAMFERDAGLGLEALIERFSRLRTANLALVAEMAGETELDRRGLHPALGEVTFRQLLGAWAVHDLDHISQIYAGLAGSYDAEVGPWRAYLGILLRRDDPAAVAG
ncbi:MAG TPA: DinB family protein [Candidatus Limnocylindrales bacterium]|jgi:hypothetical protein